MTNFRVFQRRTIWRAFFFLVVIATAASGPALGAATKLADPPPTMDQPRRIMLQLTSSDTVKQNRVLSNAINIQKFYGIDNVEIAIIAFGPGNRALYDGEDSALQTRVESLQKYGIEFTACQNTMDATGRQASDLIDGVGFVRAGIAEIAERQLKGWIYIVP